METLKMVVFLILLLDATAANLIAWFGSHWWSRLLGPLSRHLPMAKGWTVWYFVLIAWIGYLTVIG